jgi:glyoxylase-like metal-dependent hydrolase (beta-lactamase superfamily II)
VNVGPYTLSAIETGFIWLDGGAMFGTVPRVLWEKPNPPDSQHRIQLAMRALLIEGEGRRILVDCGVGDKGGEKFKEMYNVDHETHNLDSSLAAAGISRADITDVILTHLHFDHAGAATSRQEDGTYRPTFLNATYHLQERNLAVAQDPNPRERASYLRENFEALITSKRLKLINGSKNLFPGIDLWVSTGHTEAQQLVKVSDDKVTFFYCGDLIPTSSHVALPWIMGYDLHPLTMLKEKEEILESAVKKNWILFYEQDPKLAAGRVMRKGKGFCPGETVLLS